MQNKVVPLHTSVIGALYQCWINNQQIAEKKREEDINVRPLDKAPSDEDSPWFAAVPMSKLTQWSKMYKQANI